MKSIWIARDKDGSLFAYSSKPKRDYVLDAWHVDDMRNCRCLNGNWFPELTWNNEPIELVIKEKED